MKKFLKIFGIIILSAVTLMAGIYSLMWFLVARNVQAHIDAFWASLPLREDIVIVGDKPEVTGFPLPPQIHFSGVVTVEPGIAFNIPDLQIVGFPLSGLVVYLELPEGMNVSLLPEKTHFQLKESHINFAAANITLPNHPPLRATYSDIKAWSTLEDPLLINGFEIVAGAVHVRGRGTLGVNPDLQPDLRTEARVDGLDAMFDSLESNPDVDKKGLDVGRNFLKMVSKVDPQTKQTYIETGFYIQNGGVFIGPMRIYNLKKIVWPGTPTDEKLSRKNLSPDN